MKRIPKALIYLRIIIGVGILILSLLNIDYLRAVFISLLTLGVLSDIFDGIIARRLNVSTERLRRLDSTIDQVFWILVVASVFISFPNFFYEHSVKLLILICAEAMTYVISFTRFQKEVATHAITSKVWTLFLFATLIEVISNGNSNSLFDICFYIGVVTRIEIILILFILRTWTNDVPSLYHAIRLRRGKPIKRHKLFNG
jgi:phosphatidylglycerophosphate synthase